MLEENKEEGGSDKEKDDEPPKSDEAEESPHSGTKMQMEGGDMEMMESAQAQPEGLVEVSIHQLNEDLVNFLAKSTEALNKNPEGSDKKEIRARMTGMIE